MKENNPAQKNIKDRITQLESEMANFHDEYAMADEGEQTIIAQMIAEKAFRIKDLEWAMEQFSISAPPEIQSGHMDYIKNRLNIQIEYCRKFDEGMDKISWEEHEGVLISGNDAEKIIELIQNSNSIPSEERIHEEIENELNQAREVIINLLRKTEELHKDYNSEIERLNNIIVSYPDILSKNLIEYIRKTLIKTLESLELLKPYAEPKLATELEEKYESFLNELKTISHEE